MREDVCGICGADLNGGSVLRYDRDAVLVAVTCLDCDLRRRVGDYRDAMTEAESRLAEATKHICELLQCCHYQEERARRWKGVASILVVFCAALAVLALSG